MVAPVAGVIEPGPLKVQEIELVELLSVAVNETGVEPASTVDDAGEMVMPGPPLSEPPQATARAASVAIAIRRIVMGARDLDERRVIGG